MHSGNFQPDTAAFRSADRAADRETHVSAQRTPDGKADFLSDQPHLSVRYVQQRGRGVR